ncbi:MAG TPA: P1 family peptidase [Gemmatimonadaceae bacterium]|nr:P1 family peptidase [Gemmatimonadaceae bacterium]
MSADFSAVGLAVGHATDERGATGLTVLRRVEGALQGAACVFGRATGTRELEALSLSHHGRVDAVLLTGGSAYGLDAAAGVMRWMEERGRGFDVNGGVVPIVPAAVVFDLKPLGDFTARPTADMAYAACDSALPTNIEEGSIGVGTGATVGKALGREHAMKGGFGCGTQTSGGVVVCAAAVVNALGDVRAADGRIIAGARSSDGQFLDSVRAISQLAGTPRFGKTAAQNTTLCVVATNLSLERGELAQLARAAGAALFRRITPVGTSFDGDVVFALCDPGAPRGTLMPMEMLATAALEEAIERAVRHARGRDGVPGLADKTA